MATKSSVFGDASSSSWADEDDYEIPISGPLASKMEEMSIPEDHHEEIMEEQVEKKEEQEENAPAEPSVQYPENPPFKAYVGNLSYKIEEQELADIFEGLDVVDVFLPRNNEYNSSRGFGYVEFSTQADLIEAISYNGKTVLNRQIRVNLATGRSRPKTSHSRGYGNTDRRPNSFYTRDTSAPNPRDREYPAKKERPRLHLLPRTHEKDEAEKAARQSSIFGDAKPRDESKYLERKRKEAEEQKKEKQLQREKKEEKKHEKWAHTNQKDIENTNPSEDVHKGARKNSFSKKAPKYRQVSNRSTESGPALSAHNVKDNRRGNNTRGRSRGGAKAVRSRDQEQKVPPKEKSQNSIPKTKSASKMQPPHTSTDNVFNLLDSDSDSD